MFTGIIEYVGTVQKNVKLENYLVLSISHNFPSAELRTGESVACDGACLTVVAVDDKQFTVEVSQETIARTIVGSYQEGSRINLERAVRVGDRLDGHFVTGHVDNTGFVRGVDRIGQSLGLTVKYSEANDQLVVKKGSIAINGVSLTVNKTGNGWCSVNLVPHTLEHTNLKDLKVNDEVNVEFDLIGKYAAKTALKENESILTFAKLKESGW